jgi:uncharacterized protein (DUF2147 family)
MKRFCFFLALMALSSSAHAGESYSFVIAGHRIRIEAPRHCRSASCVSVSIPGIYRSNRARDRDDEVAAPAPAPVNPPAPAAAPAAPAVTRASPPVVQPVASQPVAAQPVASAPPPPPPPAVPTAPAPQLASTTAKIVVLPPPPPPVPAAPIITTTQTIAPPPPPKVEPMKTTEPPPAVVPKPIPVPAPVPPIAKISQQTEDAPADTPLGDWQTEGNKGTVRIERCGEAMCGYLINLTTDTKGDTILINMKPKSGTKSGTKPDAAWSGNIYSRSSGHTYYSTMTMKGVNRLRVEACALGRFFCSGNDWTRIDNASKLVTSRETSSRPPS